MRLFGYDITRAKAQTGLMPLDGSLSSTSWWWPTIREPFTGAWQRNMELTQETAIRHHAVYSCISLIGQDVAKIGIKLVEQDPTTKIWEEVTVAAFSPVLRKPNRYQSRIQFFEQWVYSLLTFGNTYVLKERDARNIVVALYILDPSRTRALLAPDGAVYYQLYADSLSGVTQDSQIVPADEIIHDRISAIFHPLCGLSPLSAVGLAAMQGIEGQRHSIDQFRNQAVPSGILTAPGEIPQDTADRIKAKWQANYSGTNVGRVAILGSGMKFERMAINPIDVQFIEQMKWTAEAICAAYHVPAYKVTATSPTYNNTESLEQQYYSNCLQSRFENIELLLDEGLGLVDVPGHTYGVEFDIDEGLLRMDKASKIRMVGEGVQRAIFSPNEARARFDMPPVKGGDTPLIQQQYWPIDVLTEREMAPPAPPPALGGGGGTPALPGPKPPTGPGTPGSPAPSGGDGGGGQASLSESQVLMARGLMQLALWEGAPGFPFEQTDDLAARLPN